MKQPKTDHCMLGCDKTAPMNFVGVMFDTYSKKPVVFKVCDRHVIDYLGNNRFMVVHKSLWQEFTKMPKLHDQPESLPYNELKVYVHETT